MLFINKCYSIFVCYDRIFVDCDYNDVNFRINIIRTSRLLAT